MTRRSAAALWSGIESQIVSRVDRRGGSREESEGVRAQEDRTSFTLLFAMTLTVLKAEESVRLRNELGHKCSQKSTPQARHEPA